MKKNKEVFSAKAKMPDKKSGSDRLFDRIASILEQARANVVRSVNSEMIIAYWLIGREMVQELQSGEERAEYGQQLVKELSSKLTGKYGKGFSTTNLWYFRQFYIVFSDRKPEIRHKPCGEFASTEKLRKPCGVLEDMGLAIEKSETIQGFSPRLSWSHYRVLTKVEHLNARLFYEIEAEKEGWSVPVLERQIHSFLFVRLLKSRDKDGVMALTRKGQLINSPVDTMKDPYILDFLGIPDGQKLHESKMEEAIIGNMQSFLLELGKGFAFVARQKRLSFEDENFYVDLVFYNCILKCYVLIDLKIGRLTHQDVGQMDGYLRMFDDQFTTEGDNATIGLILCSEKNEAVAKYSVLKESKKFFAAKYMTYLPTEKELQHELQRERQLIEMNISTDAKAAKIRKEGRKK